LFMRVPELTPEAYDRALADIELDANPPAGLILHVATESVGAVNVLEVWQTARAAESFVEQRLRAALDRQGVTEPLSYRIESLHNLFAPELDVIGLIGGSSLPGGFNREAEVS
jgi:hypothetical protein